MLPIDRKNEIYNLFLKNKTLTIKSMAERFKVSEQTIRRDFKELEKGGIISLTYGGASLNEKALAKKNVEFSVRQTLTINEKKEIARLTVGEIEVNESIFIDNSSTALTMVNMMEDIPINVVTNAIMVSYSLLTFTNLNVVQLGGTIDIKNKCTNDNVCLLMLEDYNFDKAFISCSSISRQHGIMDSNTSIAEIRKKVIKQSNKVYLLVDHTKFDKTSLVHISNFEGIDYVITNERPSDEWVEFLKEKEIKLVY